MGAYMAATDALNKLLAAGATYLNTKNNTNYKATDLSTLNKSIFVTSAPTVTAAWTDVLAGTKGIQGVGNYTVPTGAAGNYTGRADQTVIAEVQVDTETGNIKVLNYVASFGIGRVLWAKGLDNQFIGGFSGTGGGAALYESELRDPTTGRYINPNLHDYGPMTWMDIPDPEKLQVKWNEYVELWGPGGAKGVGEPSVGLVAPAIANAVYNATGARLRTMPFRPETVLAAIKAAGKAATITVPPITSVDVPVGGEAF
jgi:CO/xanthine dehydrogenase Mo-binding subunit